MRKTIFASLCLMLFAIRLPAQDLPRLHDVTGVAADDVLNIRAEPDADAPVIGTLAHDATGIEVVAANGAGTWGRVNTHERSGWVSLRYLAAQGLTIDTYNLPVGLTCFGTEPFWSLAAEQGALRFATPDAPARDLTVWIAQDSGVPGDLQRMIRFAGPEGPAVAHIYPATCSDGMSDRAYGLALAMMPGPNGAMLTGCCSLTR